MHAGKLLRTGGSRHFSERKEKAFSRLWRGLSHLLQARKPLRCLEPSLNARYFFRKDIASSRQVLVKPFYLYSVTPHWLEFLT